MKQIFTFLTLISSLIVFCQAPDAMNYQAVIRDANNNLLSNQSVGMQISILQGSASGMVVYTEIQTPTTNDNGLISIAIGEGNTIDDFSAIDWSDGPYFIKTETDPNGGSDYTITGTTQLLSVPYALHAKTVDMAKNGFERVSDDGDTLFLSNGQYFLIGNRNQDTSNVDTSELNNYIIDADGNIYTSVIIGEQEWMVENLRTSKYSNGDPIQNVTDDTEWLNLSSGAWCYYDNDDWYDNDYNYWSLYGKLYNWYAAADSRNICPIGWHVPSDDEFTVLTNYLAANGHSGNEGKALKSIEGWDNDGNGTDDYGFRGLPGGDRYIGGTFRKVGTNGDFWSSTEATTVKARSRELDYNSKIMSRGYYGKRNGFSVRCLRD